ncbi:MAG TPA: AraC family transcriptional regulator [Actinophytocola sp.]|uniref:AraC family transcriptional regulator n=1 Tax=Actinophytocola sp. TaxID=1872138 RepID=UPI002DBA1ECD|nr:AraC family transcriptional regulator [Actinophytocola sp.]HEU5474179.1 AraC family transcriptional regulator [Actinophytocola sp.]
MDEVVLRAVERAVDTMKKNLGDRLTIDDLARSAMFSKFHFTRVFQRVTGVSPGRFLSAMRLDEAKRLLVSTSLTVADISHQVGYNSVGTFSSRFRSSVGVSPTTYRQLGGATSHVPTHTADVAPNGTTVRGNVLAPPGSALGPIFVGLFPGRILEAPAVRYTTLPEPGPYAVPDVPPGSWHLLAYCARRAAAGEIPAHVGACGPIEIRPDITARLADVHLRPLHVLDPPVLMALQEVRPARAVAAS